MLLPRAVTPPRWLAVVTLSLVTCWAVEVSWLVDAAEESVVVPTLAKVAVVIKSSRAPHAATHVVVAYSTDVCEVDWPVCDTESALLVAAIQVAAADM